MTVLIDIEGLEYARAGASFHLTVPRFRLERGEAVAISGTSGSGKSTFLDVLALLRRPKRASTFRFADVDIAGLWQRGRERTTVMRGSQIGYILQTGGLLPYLSVRENILLPQHLRGRIDKVWTQRLLATLGLAPLARRLPAQLSLGERQRVAVARAISHQPALVLADEPTASLDADNGERVIRSLLELCRACEAGLVLVTHDRPLLDRFQVPGLACRRQAGSAWIDQSRPRRPAAGGERPGSAPGPGQ